MNSIINLQVPLDEHGNMIFSLEEMKNIINAFKDLLPNENIIASPVRLIPADSQVNLEITEAVLASIKEVEKMKHDAIFLEFLEAEGVDNWDGYCLAKQAMSCYEEHGTLDGYEPKYI